MAETRLSDPIADYLAALDARLSGPAKAKADLLAEARDGLDDAAEAHAAAGHPDPRGQAVAEFGDPARIARAYQAELGVAEGARTLRSVLLAIPVIHGLWQVNELVWIGSWRDYGPRPPDWFGIVAQVQALAGWAVAGLLVVALVAVRVLSRRAVDTRRLGRAAALLSVTGSVVLLATLLALLGVSVGLDINLLMVPWPCLLAGAVIFAVHWRLLVLSHRSLRFTAG